MGSDHYDEVGGRSRTRGVQVSMEVVVSVAERSEMLVGHFCVVFGCLRES